MILNNFYSWHFFSIYSQSKARDHIFIFNMSLRRPSSICSMNRARNSFSFAIRAYDGHLGKWMPWQPGLESTMDKYSNLFIIHWSACVQNLVLLWQNTQLVWYSSANLPHYVVFLYLTDLYLKIIWISSKFCRPTIHICISKI